MGDIRARLTTALHDNGLHTDDAAEVADALLALTDIAIVEPITEQNGAPGDTWECPAGCAFGVLSTRTANTSTGSASTATNTTATPGTHDGQTDL